MTRHPSTSPHAHRRRRRPLLAVSAIRAAGVVGVAMLALAGCGGGGDGLQVVTLPSTTSATSATSVTTSSTATTGSTGSPGSTPGSTAAPDTSDTTDGAATSTEGETTVAPSTTLGPPPTEPRPGTIAGSLYRDDNHNGERDFGEPGVPGILVSAGQRLAITDGNGSYRIAGVGYVDTLRFHTAWFRTQCDARACDPGPGSANDVKVADAQLLAEDLDATQDGFILDAGIVPDWEGDTSYPMPAPDAFTGNDVDVALRMTRYTNPSRPAECERTTGGGEHVCDVGDHPMVQLAVLNQGLEPLTDVQVALDAPAGMEVVQVSRSSQLRNSSQGDPTIGSPTDPSTGLTVVDVPGPIVPGGIAYVVVQLLVRPDAVSSPTPYPIENPYDRTLVARVIAVQPDGEADSLLCTGWGGCVTGTGTRDKLLPHDEDDIVGWGVRSTVAPAPEPISSVSVAAAPSDGGITVTVTNTGTTTVRNIALDLRIGDGLTAPDVELGWFPGATAGAWGTIWPGALRAGASISVPFAVTGAGRVDVTVTSIGSEKPDSRTDSFLPLPLTETAAFVDLAG